jgi:hypothetical protein
MRRSLVIYDFAPDPFEFPIFEENFILFLSVYLFVADLIDVLGIGSLCKVKKHFFRIITKCSKYRRQYILTVSTYK